MIICKSKILAMMLTTDSSRKHSNHIWKIFTRICWLDLIKMRILIRSPLLNTPNYLVSSMIDCITCSPRRKKRRDLTLKWALRKWKNRKRWAIRKKRKPHRMLKKMLLWNHSLIISQRYLLEILTPKWTFAFKCKLFYFWF